MMAVQLVVAMGLLQLFNQNTRAEEGVVTAQCCSQVFLSSSGVLADTQSAVLGIYTKTNTKIANNSHPVYVKHEKEDSQFYLYFRSKDNGPQGWIVGKELLEDSFYISTRNDQLDCANGIFGGFDRGQLDSYDPKFSIECHSDEVSIDCCKNLEVGSSGAIEENQGAAIGDYTYEGDFNGYPYYKGTHDMFLFYRKKGSGPDGWMISPSAKDEDLFSVTTRQKEYCPTTLTTAYDRDRIRDDTITVTCKEFRPDEFSEENDFYGWNNNSTNSSFDHESWVGNKPSFDLGSWIMNGSSMEHGRFHENTQYNQSLGEIFQSGFYIKPRIDFIENNETIGQDAEKNIQSTESTTKSSSSSTEHGKDVGELEQDPGASLKPIPPTPINSSTRETMIKSVCFRLLLIIYIAVSN